MPVPVLLLVLEKNPQKNWKTILVDQQNFTNNLTTELLTSIVSGLQRVAYWAKVLQLNQKVLYFNPTKCSASFRDPNFSKHSW